MKNKLPGLMIFNFPLTRLLAGIALILLLIVISESLRLPLNKLHLSENMVNIIIGSLQVILALTGYSIFYNWCEKRKITELSFASFTSYAWKGFFIGLALQSLCIVVIYLTGTYTIVQINGIASMLPGFIDAIVAGVVAEIILRGIFYRLAEDIFGTKITLAIFIVLFFVLHFNSKNATILSASATALQAGFMLSAAYIFSRSLWLPVCIHFAWDLAEPTIYGGINPGITLKESLFTANISGNVFITGGQTGPGNSMQSAVLCLVTGLLFLWLARKRSRLKKPYWQQWATVHAEKKAIHN